MRYEDIRVGQSAEYSKVVSDEDVRAFAQITGDFNPVHIDEEAAKRTRFGGRIAHGMLSAGLVSAAIANKLPGAGSIYLGQALRFTAPVRIGDTSTVSLSVLELMSKKRIRLATVRRNQKGDTVLDGEATILVDEA